MPACRRQERDFIIKATWFTGELRIPDGELLHYEQMGYWSFYKRDIFITVQKGKVLSQELIEYDKKKIKKILRAERQKISSARKAKLKKRVG